MLVPFPAQNEFLKASLEHIIYNNASMEKNVFWVPPNYNQLVEHNPFIN